MSDTIPCPPPTEPNLPSDPHPECDDCGGLGYVIVRRSDGFAEHFKERDCDSCLQSAGALP